MQRSQMATLRIRWIHQGPADWALATPTLHRRSSHIKRSRLPPLIQSHKHEPSSRTRRVPHPGHSRHNHQLAPCHSCCLTPQLLPCTVPGKSLTRFNFSKASCCVACAVYMTAWLCRASRHSLLIGLLQPRVAATCLPPMCTSPRYSDALPTAHSPRARGCVTRPQSSPGSPPSLFRCHPTHPHIHACRAVVRARARPSAMNE